MSSLYNLKNCLKSLFHTFNGADEESRRKPVCALSFKVRTGSKPYKLLKFFHQLCDNCKIPSCTYYLKGAELKITMFAHFKEYHGNHDKFQDFIWFGGTLSQN